MQLPSKPDTHTFLVGHATLPGRCYVPQTAPMYKLLTYTGWTFHNPAQQGMPTFGLKPQPHSAERAFLDDRQAGCAHCLQYFHMHLHTRNSPKLLFSFPTSAWYRQDLLQTLQLRLAGTHGPRAEKMSNAPLPAAGSGLTASLWKNGTQSFCLSGWDSQSLLKSII